MISTEMLYGQGLGNQLFCYISTRAIALDRGCEFGIHDPNNCIGDKRYNSKGMYFIDLDMGGKVDESKIQNYYMEKEYRYFTQNNYQDYNEGCGVWITDHILKNIPDNSHILGYMQGPDYFYHHIDKIKQWLKLKPEYDNKDFSKDDICVINVRANLNPWIYLPRTYWLNAINHMLKINSDMNFLVITEDVDSTRKLLPELSHNTYHFSIGEDYAIIKNAKYLIASNSSFSLIPSLTSDTLKVIIAPKYMLRHNVSDGYWNMGYNIYPTYTYMDREGNLFSYEECIKEFEEYDRKNNFYKNKVVQQYGKWPDVATIKPKK